MTLFPRGALPPEATSVGAAHKQQKPQPLQTPKTSHLYKYKHRIPRARISTNPNTSSSTISKWEVQTEQVSLRPSPPRFYHSLMRSTGGKAKPLKQPKKAPKGEMDEEDKAFAEKQRAGNYQVSAVVLNIC